MVEEKTKKKKITIDGILNMLAEDQLEANMETLEKYALIFNDHALKEEENANDNT